MSDNAPSATDDTTKEVRKELLKQLESPHLTETEAQKIRQKLEILKEHG